MEKPGHFEKGIWVEDKAVAAAPADAGAEAFDRRLSEATKAMFQSIDNVMNVTRDLVSTPEGKQYIEKSITDTRSQIQQSFDLFLKQARADLEKKKADLEKAKADLQAKAAAAAPAGKK